MKYDKKTKTMDYSNKELKHVHGISPKKPSPDKALTKMAGKGNVLKGKNLEGKKK